MPEEKLITAAASVGGPDNIDSITAYNGNLLVFTMKDGTTAEKYWQDRSRSESWTEEMRRAAGAKIKERNEHHG